MLTRKLIRDIARYKGQFAALVLLVTLGVSLFCAMYLAYVNLRDSAEASFERLNAAHLTAYFASAPDGLATEARRIDGVQMAAGRVVEDVSLDLEGSRERITARLISLPGPGEDPVNSLHLVRGRFLDGEYRRGVLVSSDFASFHGLEPGDRIYPAINGIRQELTIQGLVISPEYLFPAPDAGQILSTARTFGVMFVARETMAEIMGTDGQINEIVLLLAPGNDRQPVKDALREVVSGYGYRTIVELEDQPSYRLLQNELNELSTWSVMLPTLFLGAAVMIILVLLARIVRQQRPHIGLLRALGYSRGDILRYYLGFCFLVGSTGSLLGILLGYWMSVGLTNLYAQFFNIPYLAGAFHWDVQLSAALLGIGTCLLAGVFSAWQAAAIQPVEAMRPPAPPPGRRFWGERWVGFMREMPALWKFPIRNITRNPWRFNFSAVGVAVALSFLILTGSFYNLFDSLITRYFGQMVAYDARISLTGPTGWDTVHEIALWPEVDRAEALVEVPVRYRHGHIVHEGMLTGLEEDTHLFALQNADGNRVFPTRGGVLLSSNIREILGVDVGETIILEPMLEGLPARTLPVAGTVELFIGVGGFLPVEEARSLRGPGAPISAVLVTTTPGGLDQLRERTRTLPLVAGVQDITQMRAEIMENLDLMYAFIGIALLFSMLLSGAIVYSMTSITTLERMRELAIFRMQGMSRKGTGILVAAEGVLPALPGLGLGILLGYVWAGAFAAAYASQSDLMTVRLAIYPATIILALVGIVLAVALAQVPAIRSAGGIDLAEASKYRE
ncbi:MAG: FtsX-like permease family protein [Desulforudis sp.]|jgi:putative ABC transport system permease protein|nr:MAG: FtsX-like permease family protein [Desulforudis sp.]